MHETARQIKSGLRTPRTALNQGICKYVGGDIQRTFK